MPWPPVYFHQADIRFLRGTMNTSTPTTPFSPGQEGSQISQAIEGWFWTTAAISTLIVIFSIVSNILVIYFANQKPLLGALRYLNTVVKHLAVSDLLYGVLSCPFIIAHWRMGKIDH